MIWSIDEITRFLRWLCLFAMIYLFTKYLPLGLLRLVGEIAISVAVIWLIRREFMIWRQVTKARINYYKLLEAIPPSILGVLSTAKSLDAIAMKTRLPVYVGFRQVLGDRINDFSQIACSIHPNIKLAYSVKTNNLPDLLAYFYSKKVLAEVVSTYEYNLALRMGYKPSQIILNGPQKSLTIMKEVLGGGGRVNIDTFAQLEELSAWLKTQAKSIRIGVRIRTENRGLISHFGFSFGKELEQVMQIIRGNSHLHLAGVHMHVGTNIDDPRIYTHNVVKLVRWILSLSPQEQKALRYIDLGGGFAVPGSTLLTEVGRVPEIKHFLHAAIDPLRKLDGFSQLTVYFEPGRWLVDEGFGLAARVLEVKRVGNKQDIVCQVSTTCLPLATSQSLVVTVWPSNSAPLISTTIYGDSCYEGDILASAIWLPGVKVGDTVFFHKVGAYNLAQANQFIAPRPGVVMVEKVKKIRLVRRAEIDADLWRRDI